MGAINKPFQDESILKWQVVGHKQIPDQALAVSDETIATKGETLEMADSSFRVDY
jgi:hypothetical protein